MRRDVFGIQFDRGTELLQRIRQIVQVIPRGTQSVVRFRPLWFELQSSLEFVNGMPGVAFIFQRKRQVVVCQRVVWLEVQRLVVACDGFIPGLGTR